MSAFVIFKRISEV